MKLSRFIVLFTSAALLVGCSSINAASFKPKPQEVTVHWNRPVQVVPIAREDGAGRLNANGMAFDIDLNEFSSVLSKLVNDSLSKSGATLAPGDRTISIEVIYVDYMYKGFCLIDYTVTLGNGTLRGFQASGESALFDRACRKALESAVAQIVNDPQTIRYMGGA